MCREMSQYMPNSAVTSATLTIIEGRAAQPGSPVRRSAQAAALRRMSERPLRCPLASQSSAAVAMRAPLVAPITWRERGSARGGGGGVEEVVHGSTCLLYTSDAADEEDSV